MWGNARAAPKSSGMLKRLKRRGFEAAKEFSFIG
jgi:hypothetical protein